VRPSQAVEIFGNFLHHLVSWHGDVREKFHGDRPRGTPPSRGLNARGVAKYSDFGPIEGWLRGPAVEHRSLAGVLSLSCVRLVADG